MKPHSWIVALPEWEPESLPGYAEAVATLAAGGTLFPKREKGPPRAKRTVESLTEERDRLIARRSLLYSRQGVDDPGAISGIQRHSTTRRQNAATDSALEQITRLTARIDGLNHRINKR